MELIPAAPVREDGRMAILIMDGQGRPLACSQAFCDLFGAVDRLQAWDDQGRRMTVAAWAGSLGEVQAAGPLTIELADGSRGMFNVRCQSLVQLAGQPGRARGALIFEEASAADVPGEVAALVSHELRTPLTVLHAALQLLDRSLAPAEGSPVRRYLAEALTEARQLNVLTSHLLEATRLQSGNLRLQIEELSLTDAVRDVCRRALPLARGQRIELVASDRPLFVKADRARLDQMIMNLLLNAITYAPGTSRIDVQTWREGSEAAVEVRDYGPGIKSDRLARLSQPFYQPPRLDRPSRGGLGLGLYLCRGLARLHGGRLAVDSREGQGSTFTLWLPVAANQGVVREDVVSTRRTLPAAPR